ncbi:MAG: hypothetical protein WC821_04105 [archaeon]|jgi:hypothetical protein
MNNFVKHKKNTQKGQLSFEFIITVILILGIFIYGLSIFQARNDLNSSSIQKWSSNEMAWKIARNINNVYLLDDNSSIMDYIYWNETGASVSVNRVVQVYYGENYSDAPLLTNIVDWRITDLNGAIYFKKINGRVVVDYS